MDTFKIKSVQECMKIHNTSEQDFDISYIERLTELNQTFLNWQKKIEKMLNNSIELLEIKLGKTQDITSCFYNDRLEDNDFEIILKYYEDIEKYSKLLEKGRQVHSNHTLK